MTEIIEAKLSQLTPDLQQDVVRLYPRMLKALLKRLGGRVDIPAKEIDSLESYVMTMGMDPRTRRMRLELRRRDKKDHGNGEPAKETTIT